MAISLVNSANNTGLAGATASVTIPSTTAGNLLIMVVDADKNPGNVTYTPPAGWTQIGSTLNDNIFISLSSAVYYYPNCPAGTTSVSVTLSSSASAWHIEVLEFSGVATTTPLDVSTGRTQSGTTTPSSGAVTTTASGDLVVGFACEDNLNAAYTLTQPSGWTAVASFHDNDAPPWGAVYTAYQVQTSAGSINYNPTLSATGTDGNYFICSFKAAAGGGGLTGSGTIAGSSSVSGSSDLLATASPTGTSTLTASATLSSSGSMVGTSSLAGTPANPSGTISCTSSLSATAAQLRTATPTGTSVLTGSPVSSAQATCVGASSLAATPVLLGVIVVVGNSTLTGTLAGIVTGSGTISGSSSCTAQAVLLATKSVAGTSSLAAPAQLCSIGSIVGSSGLGLSSLLFRVGSASIVGSSTLVAFPTIPNAPILKAVIVVLGSAHTANIVASTRYSATIQEP